MKKSMYPVKCWLILKRVGSNHLPMDTRQTDLSLIGSSIQARRKLIYHKIESKLLGLVALLSMCQRQINIEQNQNALNLRHIRIHKQKLMFNNVGIMLFQTEMDYGSLMCWATNSVGRQEKPCVYHLIPAGRPEPVSNCTVLNQTYSTLHVACKAGFDGGLPQSFSMQV